jgi:L-rhamnose mutarotase
MLHPDYKKRLQRVWPEMTFLEVYRIDVYDLFLNKFNASRPKDFTDMREMINKQIVTREKCLPLFDEWLKHWYDGDEKLRKEFEKLWL